MSEQTLEEAWLKLVGILPWPGSGAALEAARALAQEAFLLGAASTMRGDIVSGRRRIEELGK